LVYCTTILQVRSTVANQQKILAVVHNVQLVQKYIDVHFFGTGRCGGWGLQHTYINYLLKYYTIY
jgi:hypothetical protein